MATTITSAPSGDSAYRAQLTERQAERKMASLEKNLKASAGIAKTLGVDGSAATNALQNLANANAASQAAPVSSTKVSLSPEGVARQQAEARNATGSTTATNPTNGNANANTAAVNRGERRRFASVDEAIAYGTTRAAEQAGAKSTANTRQTEANQTMQQTEAAAGSRPERRQFKSADEAIAYGAQKAIEQYNQQSGRSVSTASAA